MKQCESILLISSLADPAGSLIHDIIMRLLADKPDIAGKFRHQRFEERLIYLDGPSLQTDADLIIFLSRHSSVDPRPVLTVHVTGNFGNADFGGSPGSLTPAATGMMHAIMNRLAIEVPDGYNVTYEATHHGPTGIPVPSCFVEVGSTEKEWHDQVAATAAARAVIDAVPGSVVNLAGFGGTHYAKRQTEITLTTRGGFGHIMPTRDLTHLDQAMFSGIIEQTGADAIYIDRKSVSRQDINLIEVFAAEMHIPVVGQSDLEGLGDLPFEEYVLITALADKAVPDSSVTVHALHRARNPVIVTISSDLVAETAKINPSAFETALEMLPVAHLSGNGLAYCHNFITSQDQAEYVVNEIIRLCVSIIRSHYGDKVTMIEDIPERDESETGSGSKTATLIITEKKFSPRIAAGLGVHPGKDFGTLASGETLSIGDRLISPNQVFVETTRKIRISGIHEADIHR